MVERVCYNRLRGCVRGWLREGVRGCVRVCVIIGREGVLK